MLSEPTEEHPDPRSELDQSLRVDEWWVPGRKRYDDTTEPGAPIWWKGEEEATESFLRSMNIKLSPQGEVIKG